MAEIRITMKRVFRKGFLCLEIPEDEGIREALKRILTSCREKYNDFVQVTINPPYKPRTTGAKSQNHHLNGHIYTIINGYLLPKSEHECSTEECAKLIEAAHLLAADWQIVLKE